MGTGPRANGTSTSAFGVGRRESHDASDFYARFSMPEVSSSEDIVVAPDFGAGIFLGDSRKMEAVPDNSVALVVTSPPYFAGKAYEQALGEGHIPGTYVEYLRLLEAVFAECLRTLEPGGRIAVNVANLGRKPYRSLVSDLITILQDKLGFLLSGEVIWKKGDGASGNCAWGSFRSPANPVLRDITERVVIASKGRFDRALSPERRGAEKLPNKTTLTSDEFMAATLDVWDIEPESARRVNHPAPFPVALPERLIHLYTYEGDLVLDPFAGSGSTLVAAAKTKRRWVGYDADPEYVKIAGVRIGTELARRNGSSPTRPVEVHEKQSRAHTADLLVQARTDDFQARASREGKAAQAIAARVLEDAGFKIASKNARLRGLGVTMNFIASDADGREWYFDVTGAFTTTRGGLLRTDTMWKCLGRAHVIQNKVNGSRIEKTPLVFLTSHLPRRSSEGDVALRAAGTGAFFDAIEMLSEMDFERLQRYAKGGHTDQPLAGFWTDRDIERLA